MKFNQTLEELERISNQLREEGITVERLNRAIADLKEHHVNIESIESNIDAIRKEVIAPISVELNENKVAGKFSVRGFWVGALGIVVSIVTVIWCCRRARYPLPS